ncbi:hypothetical protein B0H67DRAFT_135696 [Lasiosphaeris hirsuta]|uniref:RRM domain-containing protein n=1 Tax=Lasiosphaeris hirsuta TaxID=260670 RepID=A0AA40E3D6_9PEZI|nr:hypothetical protein B0H67DRAFT_135696 [Lasiosphaeris hirsuta]
MAIEFSGPPGVLVSAGDPVTGPYYIIIAHIPDGAVWQDLKDWIKSQIPGKKLDIYINLGGRRNDSGWVRVIGMRNFKQVKRLLRQSTFRGHQILAHDPGYHGDSSKAVLIRAPFIKDKGLFVDPKSLPPSPPSLPPSTGGPQPTLLSIHPPFYQDAVGPGQAALAPAPLMVTPTPPPSPSLSVQGQAPQTSAPEHYYLPAPVFYAPPVWAGIPIYCPPAPPPSPPPHSLPAAPEDRQLGVVWRDQPPINALVRGVGYSALAQAQAQTQATNLDRTVQVFRAAMVTGSAVEKLDCFPDHMVTTFRTRDEALQVGMLLSRLEGATAWLLRGGPVYFHPEPQSQQSEVSMCHFSQVRRRHELTLTSHKSQTSGESTSALPTPKPARAETPKPARAETPKLAPRKLGSDTVIVVDGSSTRHLRN